MPNANSAVQLKYGLQAAFDSLTKDANTIYFVTDTNRFFVGGTEYSRPIATGSAIPTAAAPQGSLYIRTVDGVSTLYYYNSSAWTAIDILPSTLSNSITVGNNTVTTPATGAAITIPKITFNEKGQATSAQDISITLPATDVSSLMPKSGGDFTGAVTVQAPTADTNPATKKYVDDKVTSVTTSLTEAIEDITSFEYSIVESLPATGEKGTIYLITNSGSGNNIYDEYIYINSKFELLGTTQVDVSNFISKVTNATGEIPKFKADGTLESSGFTLEASVPSGAVFTDTTYTLSTAEKADHSAYTITITPSSGTAQTEEIPVFTASATGVVPAGGTAATFLKGDGTWGSPSDTTLLWGSF